MTFFCYFKTDVDFEFASYAVSLVLLLHSTVVVMEILEVLERMELSLAQNELRCKTLQTVELFRAC